MSNKIEYAIKNNICFFKMVGIVGYPLCSELEKFINLSKNKFELYIIDMSQTQRIDSTVIGVLAKITKLQKKTKPLLIGLKEDIMIILSNMGLINYFEILPEYDTFPKKLNNIREILKFSNGNSKNELLKKIMKNNKNDST